MATIPQYDEQQIGLTPLPGVRVAQPQPSPLLHVGKALGNLSDDAFKIVHGAEIAEATKLVGEGSEGLLGAIQDAKQKFDNPEEYRIAALERIKEVYDSTLEKSSSSRSRQRVEAQLANNFAAAKRHVDAGYFDKKKDRGRADADQVIDQLTTAAARDPSEENRRGIALMIGDMLGRLKADGYYKSQEVTNLNQATQKKIVEKSASMDLERDPALFLSRSKAGYYDLLDVDKRLSMSRSANAAVSTSITLQKREQEVKREAAERGIQKLFDEGAGADVIDAQLKKLSAAGVLDRNDRAFWDNKLLRGEKADDAAQTANTQKFKADFLEAGYPNGARVRRAREEARAMRSSGAIGDKGSAEINNMLIQAEKFLNSEGRAQRGEQRAIENKEEKKDKMTGPQAMQLISRNFGGRNANQPIMPGHKQDVKEFTDRVMLGGEDAKIVATEIYTAREKQIQTEKQRKKEQVEVTKSDPVAAGILGRLNELKTKR